MNRIDRVTAILIQLQSRKVVKAQDMAERFRVSLRTVYRDISTLIEAGVPIAGEQGIGYSIMEGYRLPPVMFTREEATAFLTAEKFMEKFTDSSSDASYKSAMYKVRAVLRTTEKDMLEGMEQHIEIMQHQAFQPNAADNLLQPILKSVAEKQVLHIRYTALSSSDTTERQIEPLGIFYAEGYWHLIAFCLMRKDYRDFRVDRINSTRHTDKPFHKTHPSLKTYLAERYKDFDLTPVVIRINKSIARYIEQMKYRYGFISQTDHGDELEMTFYSAQLEGFARWYLMFADYGKVVAPEALKQKVTDIVSAISKNL